MPKPAGRKLKDQLVMSHPHYLPPGQRPKCLCCDKELILNIHHPWAGNRLDLQKVESIGYGYSDNGVFCTAACGFNYGLAVARRVLYRKKDAEGSSGNLLIDKGIITRPENM